MLSRENVVICRGIVNFFFFFLLVRPGNNFQFFHTTPDSLMTRSQGLVIEKTYYHSLEEIKLLMLYIRFQNFCTEIVFNFWLCSLTIPDNFCTRTTTGYRIGLLFTHRGVTYRIGVHTIADCFSCRHEKLFGIV